MDISEYIPSVEAAQRMGKAHSYIRDLCRQGKLPGAVKAGRNWLIPRASVEGYVPLPRGRPKANAPPPEWRDIISSQRHVEPPRRQRRKKQDTGA